MKRKYQVRIISEGPGGRHMPDVVVVSATNAYNACAMVATLSGVVAVHCAVEVS